MDGRDPVIVVLISGSGSNLQALIDAIGNDEIPAKIKAVISNKADVFGLKRAEKAGIDTHVVDHKLFEQREVFDGELIQKIDSYKPDLIVLAGFMRILTSDFVRRYEGKMMNIHPSLLPKYPGLHTHKRALEAGDKEHGVTVHYVTPELDSGPNIIQAIVPTLPQDTIETLAKRVQKQEHLIYPIAVKWFIDGRLKMVKDTSTKGPTASCFASLDDQTLPSTGLTLPPETTLH
jgi:phosphoribosylglycinamide formyltransferase-1